MREILFRGKRTDSGEWVEGVPYVENNQCFMITDLFICEEYQCTGAENVEVIPETVGQYTGLTDKNGKKIFEGDILSYDKKRGVIKYDNGCYVFWWKRFDKYRPDFFKKCILTDYASFNNLEVIGNIHDNKLEDF